MSLCKLLAIAGLIAFAFLRDAASAEAAYLDPVAAVQTTRFIERFPSEPIAPVEYAVSKDRVVAVSPDGKRYAFRTVRGDVASNRVHIELWTGGLQDRKSLIPRLLFAYDVSGLGRDGVWRDSIDDVFGRKLYWLGSERLAFSRINEEKGRFEINIVDTERGDVQTLYYSALPINDYVIGKDGTLVVNVAHHVPVSESAIERDGLVIQPYYDPLMISKRYFVSDERELYRSKWIVRRKGGVDEEVRFRGAPLIGSYLGIMQTSPDRRYVLFAVPEDKPKREWLKYGGEAGRVVRSVLSELEHSPERTAPVSAPKVHYVLDLVTGEVRKLWDAPSSPDVEVGWLPGTPYLAMAGAHTPDLESKASREGRAIVVFNMETGDFERVAYEPAEGDYVRIVPASRDTFELHIIRLGGERRTVLVRREARGWSPIERIGQQENERIDSQPRFQLHLKQNIDTPPVLVATEPGTSFEVVLHNPNPNLTRRYALGRTEVIKGTLRTGELWEAVFQLPSSYKPGERYAVVLQSVYAWQLPLNQFHLYGQGAGVLGPSTYGAYPGRVFLSRGIIPVTVNASLDLRKKGEADRRQALFEAVYDEMVSRGYAHPKKVGLLGFSRNGYYVLHTLVNSRYPFAAAITNDNVNFGYLQYLFNSLPKKFAEPYGVEPFGEGMKVWLEQAASFRAERIRAPLLSLVMTDPVSGLISGKEVQSRMSWAGLPHEVWAMPNSARHGSHTPQNPHQVVSVMERTLDWFDFWLNGREDNKSAKAAQYARWRILRQKAQRLEPRMTNFSSPAGAVAK